MSLTEEMKEYAMRLGIDFIGFCSVDRLNGAPEERRPTECLKGAMSVISIGYKLNYSSIRNIPKNTAFFSERLKRKKRLNS